MKKIIYSLVIIIIIIFCLVGCHSDAKSTSQINTTINPNSIETTDAKQYKPQTYSIIGTYHDSLAWVKYGENDQYWGCIDKDGKMLFQYSCNDLEETDLFIPPAFENGYTYLKSTIGTQIFVINKSGDIVGSFDTPAAYGYGYTVVENHYSDFDSAYYEYLIYNPDGDKVETLKTADDSELAVNYCGDGVFSFKSSSGINNYLFFAKKDKLIDYNYICASVDDSIKFNNGLALTVNNSYDLKPSFVIIDSDGKITEIDAKDEHAHYREKYTMFGAKRENQLIYGNSIIYYDEDKPKLSSYNVTNDSFSDFKDEKTLEKLETHYSGSFSHVDISPSFNNDGFLISLVGADGLGYVTILDYSMSMQIEPIQGDSFEAYDNGTCSIDTTIYDMKGNKLYTLSDRGYEKVISDSDDILFVCGYQSDVSIDKDYFDNNGDKCNFAALDKNGNILFDKIDISNVITKSLDYSNY